MGWLAGVLDALFTSGCCVDDCIDLMQIHNLVDWEVHLTTLREMKAYWLIRYIGITYYSSSAYDAVESVLMSTPLDFLHIIQRDTHLNAQSQSYPTKSVVNAGQQRSTGSDAFTILNASRKTLNMLL